MHWMWRPTSGVVHRIVPRLKGDLKYCGKTGTSQVRKITQEQRDLNIKNKDLPWKYRDHSLFTGYGPVSNPEYAISVIIDHGGSGSSKAAPISKKIMSKVFELYYQKEKMSSLNKGIIENFF